MHRFGWIALIILLMTGVPDTVQAETLEKVLRAPHSQRVYDYAGVLTVSERAQLRRKLLALEPQHLAQGAIVIVHRIDGSTPERFAHQILNRWGVGEKGRNNGFVILVAIDQRKWRLQTGSGLRKKISDAAAGKLMREAVVPSFRRKQYAEGLEAAVAAIRAHVLSERVSAAALLSDSPASQPESARAAKPAHLPDLLIGIGCFVLFATAALIWLAAGAATAGSGTDSDRSASYPVHSNGHQYDQPVHSTSHVHQDSTPPSPPVGGDYGGGNCDGGGASGGW